MRAGFADDDDDDVADSVESETGAHRASVNLLTYTNIHVVGGVRTCKLTRLDARGWLTVVAMSTAITDDDDDDEHTPPTPG